MIKKLFNWMIAAGMAAQIVNCGSDNKTENCQEMQEYWGWSLDYACEEVPADYYNTTTLNTRRGDGYDGPCASSEGLYCCCHSSSNSSGNCGSDITEEQQGVDIIVGELSNQGYVVQRNDGSWRITLYNPDTRAYDLVLDPDVRFSADGRSSYGYFEFSSPENPGADIDSIVPLYKEIQPSCERDIREIVRNNL